MKLQINKNGVWYGSFKFGAIEYIAIVEIIAIVIMLLGHFPWRFCK